MTDANEVASVLGVHLRQANLLSAFMEAAVRGLHSHFRMDASIIGTRLAISILRDYHFQVRALPVVVIAENAAYQAQVAATGHEAVDAEELLRWRNEHQAVRVAIGHEEAFPNHWVGHLIAIVNRSILIDLALPLYSSPTCHMQLAPILAIMPEHFDQQPDLATQHSMMMDDGSRALYHPKPSNIGYIKRAAWSNQKLYQDCEQAVRTQMAAKIKTTPIPSRNGQLKRKRHV